MRRKPLRAKDWASLLIALEEQVALGARVGEQLRTLNADLGIGYPKSSFGDGGGSGTSDRTGNAAVREADDERRGITRDPVLAALLDLERVLDESERKLRAAVGNALKFPAVVLPDPYHAKVCKRCNLPAMAVGDLTRGHCARCRALERTKESTSAMRRLYARRKEGNE